jgi:hypothetical protein
MAKTNVTCTVTPTAAARLAVIITTIEASTGVRPSIASVAAKLIELGLPELEQKLGIKG